MEIVHVAGFYPPHLGGQELVVQQLARMQAPTHRVTVYTSDAGARDLRPRLADGVRVVRGRTWQVAHTPIVPGMLPGLLRHRPRPDVIHVHTGQSLVPEVAWLAARLRGVPYVAHVHLIVGPSGRLGRALLPVYQRILLRAALGHADAVVCLTGAMREQVIRTFGLPPHRVTVVPNGVDTAAFPAGEFAARAPRELLFVGRLTVQKNARVAVAAMRLLPRDVTLRIVGDGELRPQLERLAAGLGLPNVRFEGQLPPDEVLAAYRRAAAVLMPSVNEGLPLVLLEAMSAGAPVVCSALPELVEVGGPAVVTVHPVTPNVLAATVQALLDDAPRRAALSAAGRRRAEAYGWPAVATAVDGVYSAVRAGRA
jgi:glycosyltransferase involved in cell wall biosynthesis